jgi:rhamnosyltransferase
MLGYGAGFFFFIPRIFRKKLLTNVDGIEWKRDKYSRLEKLILYWSEKAAVRFADVVVADSMGIKGYIDSAYGKKATFIAYGANEPETVPWDASRLETVKTAGKKFSRLEPDDFYLVVARLEHANNIHTIVEGFGKAATGRKLVIVGDFASASYRKLVESVVDANGLRDRVIFTGGIYRNRLLDMLRQHNYAYIHGHSAGGTNPSLLEAMILRNLIIAHDNQFNREVGVDSLGYFRDADELAAAINAVEGDFGNYRQLKEKAHARVTDHYSWDKIAREYDAVFRSLPVAGEKS